MQKNRKIFISSLVTVAAVGALSMNMAHASYAGVKNPKRQYERSQISIPAGVHSESITADLMHNELEPYAHSVYSTKRAQRAAVHEAMEHGDWSLFREAYYGKQRAHMIDTQEKFHKMYEAHVLFKQGRVKEAKDIAHEIGIFDRDMWHKVVG